MKEKDVKLNELENSEKDIANKLIVRDIDEMKTKISNFAKEVEDKDKEIQKLKMDMGEKINRINDLENKIDQLTESEKRTNTKHMSQHNDAEINTFNCQNCDKGFKSKKGLKIHTRVHQETIPQVDGMDTSVAESTVDEGDKMDKNNSLSRLMELTMGINSQTYFRWEINLEVCLIFQNSKSFFVPSVFNLFTERVHK